ncbi:MAG: hypothetical protein WBD32_07750 [Acidobacteriaceae bacterium]
MRLFVFGVDALTDGDQSDAGKVQPLEDAQRILRIAGEAAAVVEQDDIERAGGRQSRIQQPAKPRTVRADTAQSLIRVSNFISESVSGRLAEGIEDSHPAHGLVLDLRHRISSIVRFKLYIVTDAVMSDRIKELPEDAIGNIPCDLHSWDITRFY